MKKHKSQSEKKPIALSQITLDGSLGLLALGDVAFTAWRKVKKEHNASQNDTLN